MIAALLLGLVAFGLLVLYDWLEAYRKRHVSLLFFAGAALLVIATAWLLILSDFPTAFAEGTVRFLIGAICALLSAAGMIYTLFFALPFADVYAGAGKKSCVSHGWYALCRHPAALFCYLIFCFLLLMAPGLPMLLAFALFPNFNLFYVVLEDRWFFPRTIKEYELYKKETPFLIPSRASIKRMRG